MSEAQLQQIIVMFIKTYYPQLVINLSLSGINLSGLSSKQIGVLFKDLVKQGFRKGIPDLLIYLPEGKVLNLELKKPSGGVQSEHQKEIESELKQLGHTYELVTSKEQVKQLLIEHMLEKDRLLSYQALMVTASWDDTKLLTDFLFFTKGTPLDEVDTFLKDTYGITHL